jgi:hypothetical protein
MLLGTRPNIKPVFLMQVGVPPELLPPRTPPVAPLSNSPPLSSVRSVGSPPPAFTLPPQSPSPEPEIPTSDLKSSPLPSPRTLQ